MEIPLASSMSANSAARASLRLVSASSSRAVGQ
jgi:hypothetical protein